MGLHSQNVFKLPICQQINATLEITRNKIAVGSCGHDLQLAWEGRTLHLYALSSSLKFRSKLNRADSEKMTQLTSCSSAECLCLTPLALGGKTFHHMR